MNFRAWFEETVLNESVFYSKKPDRFAGLIFNAREIGKLPVDKIQMIKDNIVKYLNGPKEHWTGSPKQFVDAMRHNFTDYDEQQNKLLSMPPDGPGRGCKKLLLRVQNAQLTYNLVKGIIDKLAPDNLDKASASQENHNWLVHSLAFCKKESDKLNAGCNPSLFIAPTFSPAA